MSQSWLIFFSPLCWMTPEPCNWVYFMVLFVVGGWPIVQSIQLLLGVHWMVAIMRWCMYGTFQFDVELKLPLAWQRAVLTSMLHEWAHVCLAWQKGYFIRFKWYAVWMSAYAPSLAERLFYCFNLYAAWMSATAPDLAERSFYVWLLCDWMALVKRKLQFWSQGPSDVLWKETALSSLTDTCIVITHSIERQGEEVLGHLGQHIGHSWLYCSNSHHNNMIDYVGLAFYHVTLWAMFDCARGMYSNCGISCLPSSLANQFFLVLVNIIFHCW